MKQSKRSSLFLIELMAAILFFSLSAAVCMQLFAKSRLLSSSSSQLHQALLQAQSTAETLEAGDGTLSVLEKVYPSAEISGSRATLYYDRNWDVCSPEDSTYQLSVELTGERLIQADISVDGTASLPAPIYELHTKFYRPREVTDYE